MWLIHQPRVLWPFLGGTLRAYGFTFHLSVRFKKISSYSVPTNEVLDTTRVASIDDILYCVGHVMCALCSVLYEPVCLDDGANALWLLSA